MGSKRFPADMEQYVRSIAAGRDSQEIADMVNAHYGFEVVTRSQICGFKKYRHICSGYDCRFKPGHVARNKGKKQSEFMSPDAIERSKRGRFSNEHHPFNKCEVGTVRMATVGYLKRKIAEPNIWRFEHQLVWEAAHGPIPPGHMITFLDGNVYNCSLGNLMLISKKENGVLNYKHMRSSNAELTRTAILTARLRLMVKEKKHKYVRK